MTRLAAAVLVTVLAAPAWAPILAQAEEISLSVTPVGETLALPAVLFKPEGNGPFPAIVMLHGCGGPGPRASGGPWRWASELVPQGYVVLIPDSFTPRGLPKGICTGGPGTRTASGDVRAADAYGALAALRRLPYVDGKRVGLMGNSHGGRTTLAALVVPTKGGKLVEARRDGFVAGLALYPRCSTSYGSWKVTRAQGASGPVTGYGGVYKTVAPLLILSGALDDWTPAEPCRVMVETARAAGQPLAIKIYPGAHHGFDSAAPVRFVAERGNPDSPTGKGATTGGNREAWDDARHQVRDFFATHLKPGQ
jgi:dienelactone hydrolase